MRELGQSDNLLLIRCRLPHTKGCNFALALPLSAYVTNHGDLGLATCISDLLVCWAKSLQNAHKLDLDYRISTKLSSILREPDSPSAAE